jgi:hypothetical protein
VALSFLRAPFSSPRDARRDDPRIVIRFFGSEPRGLEPNPRTTGVNWAANKGLLHPLTHLKSPSAATDIPDETSRQAARREPFPHPPVLPARTRKHRWPR